MQFTVEIPDDVIASVDQFVATQHRVEHDPETNSPRVTKLYSSAQDFVEKAIAQVLTNVTQQFPTAGMRQHLIAKRQAELAMEAAIKPTLMAVATPGVAQVA